MIRGFENWSTFDRFMCNNVVAHILPLPPESIDEGIVVSGCALTTFICSPICSFAWTDLVTMISHDLLE